ncbi:MAG: hypothetical protein VB140_02290 [Burkholderia sp.]
MKPSLPEYIPDALYPRVIALSIRGDTLIQALLGALLHKNRV